jgi:hypothetical protein
MQIKVKVGKVEIEFTEETPATDYPRIVSKDKYVGEKTKADQMLIAIKEIADKAAQIHKEYEG